MAAPPEDDMLREAARARGFRLVKSRRRKPGGDFGRYGLIGLDSGRECLGFSPGGLTATPDEVLAYLRGGELASWKRSLIGVVERSGEEAASTQPARPERSRGAPVKTPAAEEAAEPPPQKEEQSSTKATRHPRESGGPASSPRPGKEREKKLYSRLRGNDSGRGAPPPPPEPVVTIREATRRDAAALSKLLGIPASALAERLAAALRADEPPLVADRDGPVGLIAWTVTPTLQHGPRGWITLLIVSAGEQRQGIGTRLLGEAEQRLQDAGIGSVELSLDIDFDAPAAFLRRTGYVRTANGYGKTL